MADLSFELINWQLNNLSDCWVHSWDGEGLLGEDEAEELLRKLSARVARCFTAQTSCSTFQSQRVLCRSDRREAIRQAHRQEEEAAAPAQRDLRLRQRGRTIASASRRRFCF